MVEDINNTYAEQNDEDTVLNEADIQLNNNMLVIGNNEKQIKILVPKYFNGIVFLVNGVVQLLEIQPNKKLGIDANGNLAWM